MLKIWLLASLVGLGIMIYDSLRPAPVAVSTVEGIALTIKGKRARYPAIDVSGTIYECRRGICGIPLSQVIDGQPAIGEIDRDEELIGLAIDGKTVLSVAQRIESGRQLSLYFGAGFFLTAIVCFYYLFSKRRD